MQVCSWAVHRSAVELDEVPHTPMLLAADFKAFSKVSIENSGFNQTVVPPKFKVKEYCPLVFRDLRERCGVGPASFVDSMCGGPLTASYCPGSSTRTV